MSLAEFTHPVIASLDLPSLPQAVKSAKNFYFFFSLPLSAAGEERSPSEASVGELTRRHASALMHSR
jgi:hypothetical protein